MKISLLIADVDGTLVDDDKRLSEANRQAAQRLHEAGIGFTIISARPPKGLAMLVEPLSLRLPLAGYNGGRIVTPSFEVLRERRLGADAARAALGTIHAHALSPWVFVDDDWRILDPDGPHVAHEEHTIGYGPTVVGDFASSVERSSKIVGVSDDYDRVAQVEALLATRLGGEATAIRSQRYYVDVSHPQANKGVLVDYLAAELGIPREEIAVIGDQANDLFMFDRAGFRIAMGNAPERVQARADVVTTSNNASGFAAAVDRFILGQG